MNIEEIVEKSRKIIENGMHGSIDKNEMADVLSTQLFEFKRRGQRLIEVRDYDDIKEKGTFKYAGLAESMLSEGLMPRDVYNGLKAIGLDRHIGPSYLRVKGLLAIQELRTFFGKQLAHLILNHLIRNPSPKEGYLVCIPNMTGGAWIGDETRRQLSNLPYTLKNKVWKATPYARGFRKTIETKKRKDSIENYVEGLLPIPRETSVILCFEELRTTSETTVNALKVYLDNGYTKENGVKLIACTVFDYEHPVGVKRLEKLGVDRLCLIDGLTFFDMSKTLGYITEKQYNTVTDWLSEPWRFTRYVLDEGWVR